MGTRAERVERILHAPVREFPPGIEQQCSYKEYIAPQFKTKLIEDINAPNTVAADLQFFTFESDNDGEPILSALEQAARDNKRTRLLVERIGQKPSIFRKTSARLRELNNLFRAVTDPQSGEIFNAFEQRRTDHNEHRLNPFRKDHKKIVTVTRKLARPDGTFTLKKTAGVGGVNVSDRVKSWIDYMIEMQGPMVDDLQADFDLTWNGTNNQTQKIDYDTNSFILKDNGKDGSITEYVLEQMKKDYATIQICTPYPGLLKLVPALVLAKKRAKKQKKELNIELMIPEPAKNNNPFYKYLPRWWYDWVKAAGINLHIYEDNMLHAKFAYFGGSVEFADTAVITSDNFNRGPLSGRNKEIAVITDHAEAIAVLKRVFTQIKDKSRPY